MTINVLRKKWVWAMTAVVLVACGGAATMWIANNSAETVVPPEDCARVAEIDSQWRDVAEAEGSALAVPPGTMIPDSPMNVDSRAGIDRYLTLSANARNAADSVVTPALKENLMKWADGFALVAQLKKSQMNPAPMAEWSPAELASVNEVGALLYDTVPALRQLCPNALPQGA